MAIKKETIHGFWVTFDEEARERVRYLREDLQYKEAKTLFDAARDSPPARIKLNL